MEKEVAVPACDFTTLRIQALLEAAQQSEYLVQPLPNQQTQGAVTSATLDEVVVYNSGLSASLDLNTNINDWGDLSFFNNGWVDIFPNGMSEPLDT